MAKSRPERFVNRLIAEGISVHNIRRTGRSGAVMTVRHHDLARALALAEETGCEAEVIRRGGLVRAMLLLKNRLVLVLALLFACAALAALSRRLLAVRIEGADANLSAELMETAEQLGVRRFCPISSIDTALLSAKLRSVDPRISFVSAAAEGVVLKIGVSLGEEDRRRESGPPCSIYADKDCVILRIAALDGKLCVKAGDAVKVGQLLVDGNVTPEGTSEQTLVHAAAEIIGEAAYRFSVNVEASARLPARSGRSAELTRLSLFGLNIDSDTGFERFEDETETGAWLSAFPLPIRITGGKAWEIALVLRERSKDDMIAEAEARADRMLAAGIPKDARLISKTTELVWNEDGSLTLTVSVRTIENIGYSRYL